MTAVVLDYTCSACNAVSAATVEVSEPDISESDLATLRHSRQVVDGYKAKLGVAVEPENDPGEEMRRSLRSTFAHDALLYATCPSCNARNPQGVTAWRANRRNWKWGLAGLFGLLAAISHFAPSIALFVPTVSTFLLGSQLFLRARAKLPFVWSAVAFQALMIAAFFVGIIELPRYAFVVPLLVAIQMLCTPSSDDPFENAKETIVFRKTPYRS